MNTSYRTLEKQESSQLAFRTLTMLYVVDNLIENWTALALARCSQHQYFLLDLLHNIRMTLAHPLCQRCILLEDFLLTLRPS